MCVSYRICWACVCCDEAAATAEQGRENWVVQLGSVVVVVAAQEAISPLLLLPACLPACIFFCGPNTHTRQQQQMTENGRLAQTVLQRRRPIRRAGQRLERQWWFQNGGSFGLVVGLFEWQNARHAPGHLRPYCGSTDSLPADRRAIRPHSGAGATSRHLLVVSAQRTRHLHVFVSLKTVDKLFGIPKSTISSRVEAL